MLKARRKEPTEQTRFPAPREGFPEDPRPFVGSDHLAAAAAVQKQLTARCLVAVVGRLGSGKSTTCRRAANSRSARQWFLHDDDGQPVHRRFWVDLEDCRPGPETQERIAHALGRPNFDSALARLGGGKPCLFVLDNADDAFGGVDDDGSDTWRALVACVARGASIVVSRRSVTDLDVERPWTEVVEVPGFGTDGEARDLFDQLAPRHASDLRVDDLIAACDRLPLAVSLLAKLAAATDMETARLRIGAGVARGLDFALGASVATLDPEDRQVWGALSQFPAGLGSDEIAAILPSAAAGVSGTIRLHGVGIVQRCEAGVRVPAPLRLTGHGAGLTDAAIADLWRRFVRHAQHLLDDEEEDAKSAQAGAQAADRWLSQQVISLDRLASRDPLPDGTLEFARRGLVAHASGPVSDTLDTLLVRLAERSVRGVVPIALAQTVATLEEQRRFGTSALLAATLVEAHRRSGDSAAEAAVLCQLGRAERLSGRYEEAETHLRHGWARSEELGDAVGQGSALFELGQVDLERGRLDEAEGHLAAALSLFAANGRPIGEANVNLDLVRVDLARGRLDSAERRLGDARDRFEQAGHRLGSANAQLQLGQLELARDRLDEAEHHFEGALDRYEQAGDKVGFANAFLQLGQVDLARGQLGNAERRFAAALAGYERVADNVGRANALLQLGQIDLARGRLDSAADRLGEALGEYEQLGDRIGMGNASLQLGQVHLGRGELDAAGGRLGAAQRIYDEIGDRLGSANSRHIEALILQAQRRLPAAMATFGEAARLYSSLGRTASAAWSLAGAAGASTGRAERAGYAADAVRLLQEAGMADAAALVASQFAEPEPEPEPEPQLVPEPEAQPERKTKLVPAPVRKPEPQLSPPLEPDLVPSPGPADLDVTWGPIDPRELLRVAHGEPDAGVTPKFDPVDNWRWSDEATTDSGGPPSTPEADDEEGHRRPRFRLGRKKDRKGDRVDPPTLPGLER